MEVLNSAGEAIGSRKRRTSCALVCQILSLNAIAQTEICKLGRVKGGFYGEMFPTVVYFLDIQLRFSYIQPNKK
jgi:hypothetical protein